MKIKKKTKPGVCNAMRCTEPAVVVNHEGGLEFCAKHSEIYEREKPIPPAPADPSNSSTTPPPESTEPENEPGAPEYIHQKAPDAESVQAIVGPAKDEADAIYKALDEKIQIHDQNTLDIAGRLLIEIKGKHKELETKRTSVTKPMLDAKRQIDQWFKPAKDALAACEALLKEKVKTYTEAAEQAKAEALAAGDVAAATAMVAPEMPEGLQSRGSWDFLLEDLDAVPREYLALDASKVRIELREKGEALQIPGIKVYWKKTIAASNG